MKQSIIFLGLFLAAIATPARSDFSIRAAGPFVSDDETVTDAAGPHWLLVRGNLASEACLHRVNIESGDVVNLCDQGLHNAVRVNAQGVVLGTTRGKTDFAVWSDRAGLKVLQRPAGAFTWIWPADLADNGMAIGSTTLVTTGVSNGYVWYDYAYQAHVWDAKGATTPLLERKGWDTQGLAINSRGVSVVYATRHFASNERRLYTGKRRLRRIDHKGAALDRAMDSRHRINRRGQILSAHGYLFSPKTGWRELLEDCRGCGRSMTPSLSEQGQAIFDSGRKYAFSDFPNPANGLLCLTSQNRMIEGTTRRISDFGQDDISGAFFLDQTQIVMSADLQGDDRSQRIFILEGVSGRSEDYCPTLAVNTAGVPWFNDCSGHSTSKVMTCRGSVLLNSVRGPLVDVPLYVSAKQYVSSDAGYSCATNQFDLFTSHSQGTAFEITTDPGFHYAFRIADPRYSDLQYSGAVIRDSVPITTAINSCRKPFEALPAENR